MQHSGVNKMETKEIIINLFILSAIVVPITLLIRSATKANSMLKQELIKLNSYLPIVNDIWMSRAIAIEASKLTFVNLSNHERFFVDLSKVIDCSIVMNNDEIITKERDISSADTLDLILVEKGLKHKFIKMNFYDTNLDEAVQANFHLQLALKWKKIILEKIQAFKTVKA